MAKWLVILAIVAAAGYYAMQEWPFALSRWIEVLSRGNNAPAEPGAAAPSGETATTTASTAPGGQMGQRGQTGPTPAAALRPAVEAWGDRNVGGLRLALPCTMQPYSPPQAKPPPANVFVEYFKGEMGGTTIYFAHAMNSKLIGAPMLAWSDGFLGNEAARQGFQVLSSNTATTIINGLRARRSDYISASGAPRIRARCVLLERASHAWFIECHAPETDAEAERIFLRIASSAQQI